MSPAQKYGMTREAVTWSKDERACGSRPLLVMLHGWSYDETHLYRLITPRLPEGRGRLGPGSHPRSRRIRLVSEPGNPIGDPQPAVANAAAEDVLSWLESVDAPSIGLAGFSQGGAMALQLMRLAPERFAYFVTLAASSCETISPATRSSARRGRRVLGPRPRRHGHSGRRPRTNRELARTARNGRRPCVPGPGARGRGPGDRRPRSFRRRPDSVGKTAAARWR